ncbi:hypothetical protein ACI65C_004251 [Semiaphis heraclei]
MSSLTENNHVISLQEMEIIKKVSVPTKNELSSSTEEDEVKQHQIESHVIAKTHCWSDDGQRKSYFRSLPSSPNVQPRIMKCDLCRDVLPRTMKCDLLPNVNRPIVVDAALKASQQPANDAEQDGVDAQQQPTPQQHQELQLEQPQSTDVPPQVVWYPGEEDNENGPETKSCCDGCLYGIIWCCDLLSIL